MSAFEEAIDQRCQHNTSRYMSCGGLGFVPSTLQHCSMLVQVEDNVSQQAVFNGVREYDDC